MLGLTGSSSVGRMFDLFSLTVIIGQNELDHQASHSLGVPSFQECSYFLGKRGQNTQKTYC